MPPTNPADLAAQKRLLKSLGFGFLEEPLPELPKSAAAPPRPSRRVETRRTPQHSGNSRSPAARRAEAPLADAPLPPLEERRSRLAELAVKIDACSNCGLGTTRARAVPGGGRPDTPLFVIGELPSVADDQAGQPFQGEFEELLTKMIGAMKFSMEDVFLTHAVKCHTAGARPP